MHEIKLDILRKLLFSKRLRYSRLKDEETEGSHFTYHLDALLRDGLITKLGSGMYELTQAGKEYANRMHTNSSEMRIQPKLTTVICCVREANNFKQYLIYTRKKNPFFGCQGFPTEKVWFGENIADAAKRGLKEETNLKGEGELIGIRHYKVFSKEKELLEDKVMFIFKFLNPSGKLIGCEEGKYEWISEYDISKKVIKPLEEFFEIYKLLRSGTKGISFKEGVHITNNF
ncbi:MAG: NUDIX domain-containing protein [Candidatus Dojkabacteria bacterium]|nr:NUDIX domain-containing protein [Candidatus Dojkabacteria bacterium]